MSSKLASRVRGLSEAQFREAYGTEERCRAVVEELRWPEGFVCPLCGRSAHSNHPAICLVTRTDTTSFRRGSCRARCTTVHTSPHAPIAGNRAAHPEP